MESSTSTTTEAEKSSIQIEKCKIVTKYPNPENPTELAKANLEALEHPLVLEWLNQPDMPIFEREMLRDFPFEPQLRIAFYVSGFLRIYSKASLLLRFDKWCKGFVEWEIDEQVKHPKMFMLPGVTQFFIDKIENLAHKNLYRRTMEKILVVLSYEIRYYSISWLTRALGFFRVLGDHKYSMADTNEIDDDDVLYEKINVFLIAIAWAHLSGETAAFVENIQKGRDSSLMKHFCSITSSFRIKMTEENPKILMMFNKKIVLEKCYDFPFVLFEMERSKRTLTESKPRDAKEKFFYSLLQEIKNLDKPNESP